MSNTENLLEGMENIFHNGPTDISDKVANIRIEARKAGTVTVKEAKKDPTEAKKLTGKDKPVSALWEPVKPDPNWMSRLKNCVKWTSLFSGLCLLFFYWQQADLMESAAAVPSMLTCMLCAGVSVGKNIAK